MGAESSKLNEARPYVPLVNQNNNAGKPFLRRGPEFPEAKNMAAVRKPSAANLVARSTLLNARALASRQRILKAQKELNALSPIEKVVNNAVEVARNTPAIPGIAFSGQRSKVTKFAIRGGKRKTRSKTRKATRK
jgi:hypothetical protein